jgi:beta-xylosidase/AraC-like DNA-binding protein
MRDMMAQSFKIYLSDLSEYQFDTDQNIYFIYFLRGKTKLSLNLESDVMETNDFILTNISDHIDIHPLENTLAYIFEMSEMSLLSYTDILSFSKIHSKQMSQALVKQATTRFFSLVNQDSSIKPNDLLIESYLLQFLDVLGHVSLQHSEKGIHTGDVERIQLIKRIIHKNLNKRMSIEELAIELHLSPQYLSRYIKEKFGLSYLHYISKLRLQFAEKDLTETSLSLTAIANQRGFANVNTLIRTFKTFHDMTPKAYRMMHQNKIESDKKDFSKVSVDDEKLIMHQVSDWVSKWGMDEEKQLSYMTELIHADVSIGEVSEISVSKTINLGFARNILTNAFQEHLKHVQTDLGFTYARFQGIFDHGIIDRIPNTEFYNFSKANRIIDFLYANQLLPFIELGNKPEKINFSAEQYVSLTENNRLYRNPHEWQQLVKGFIKNCINRYGTNEVSKWIFDYWYPHGKALEYSISYADMYISNYRILYDSIKHYLPTAMVGGMSLNITANETTISTILNLMMTRKVPFDFISISAFHTEGYHHIAHLTTNPHYLTDKVNTLKKLSHLGKTPLILAEWSFDVSTRNFLHDSLFMASFIMKNLIEQSAPFYDMAYWLMSDLMIEFTDTNQVLFGGNGLLSVDGLPKPSYFAYQLYRRLGKRVIKRGDGYIITSNSMDSYQVLLYHYQHPSELYCTQYQPDMHHDQVSKIFSDLKERSVQIKLDHLVKGHYRIKKYHISEENGTILNEWIHLGATSNLSKSEIQYLKNITQPALRIDYTDETDVIVLDETIKSHELLFIQIGLEYKES